MLNSYSFAATIFHFFLRSENELSMNSHWRWVCFISLMAISMSWFWSWILCRVKRRVSQFPETHKAIKYCCVFSCLLCNKTTSIFTILVGILLRNNVVDCVNGTLHCLVQQKEWSCFPIQQNKCSNHQDDL